jgi:multidrug efflux pump subunit AcrB
VIIDMPEGTTLERTSAVTKEIAQYLSTKPGQLSELHWNISPNHF